MTPIFLRVVFLLSATAALAAAKVVEYDLDIAETTQSPAGKSVRALTINGGIPGPTLRFTVGDTARITVRNQLRREETSIHWHGLLVPNLEDGVPGLTTPRIKAGQSRTFEFIKSRVRCNCAEVKSGRLASTLRVHSSWIMSLQRARYRSESARCISRSRRGAG